MARRGDEEPPLTLFSFQDIIMSVSGIITLVALLIGLHVTTSGGSAGGAAAEPQVADRSDEIRALEEQHRAATARFLSLSPGADDTALAGPGLQDLRAARQAASAAAQDLTGQAQALAAVEAQEAKLAGKLKDLQGQVRDLEGRLTLHVPDWIQLKADRPTTAVVYLVECSDRQLRCGKMDDLDAAMGFDASAAGQERLRETLARHRDEDVAVVLMVKPSAIGYALELAEHIRQQTGLPVGYDALLEDQVIFPRR